MSDYEHETPPRKLAVEARQAVERIIEIDEQVEPLRAEKSERLTEIRSKLREFGIPEEAKLVAAALLNTDVRNAFDVRERLGYLQGLNEAVEAGRGGLIAWIGQELETVSYRDPGPNVEEEVQYLKIDRLPADATIQVDSGGTASIPVETLEKLPIHRLISSAEVPAINIPRFGYPFGTESIPVMWTRNKKPYMFIGEDAILGLFDVLNENDVLTRDDMQLALRRAKARLQGPDTDDFSDLRQPMA